MGGYLVLGRRALKSGVWGKLQKRGGEVLGLYKGRGRLGGIKGEAWRMLKSQGEISRGYLE